MSETSVSFHVTRHKGGTWAVTIDPRPDGRPRTHRGLVDAGHTLTIIDHVLTSIERCAEEDSLAQKKLPKWQRRFA